MSLNYHFIICFCHYMISFYENTKNESFYLFLSWTTAFVVIFMRKKAKKDWLLMEINESCIICIAKQQKSRKIKKTLSNLAVTQQILIKTIAHKIVIKQIFWPHLNESIETCILGRLVWDNLISDNIHVNRNVEQIAHLRFWLSNYQRSSNNISISDKILIKCKRNCKKILPVSDKHHL